ncbi:MAG: hypothetical protein RSC06_06620 [Clostridia bacterium]
MYEELKRFSDADLAARMLNYIDRTDTLMKLISDSLEHKSSRIISDRIHYEYRELKEEIKEDAHYCDLVRNKDSRSRVYLHFFIPSIMEASAYGFMSPTNSQINQKFFSCVYDAHYKLTKYYSRDEWEAISNI